MSELFRDRISISPAVLRERIRWVLLARVSIITVFLGAWGISVRQPEPLEAAAPLWAIGAVLALAYSISLATIALESTVERLRWLAAIQVGADVALISAAIPLTGGLRSPMAVWYNLAIIGAAALLLRRGALAAAALASITYGVLANVLYYGWLPEIVLSWSPPPPTDIGILFQIGANIVSYFAIAFLSAVFVERIATSEASLADAEARLQVSEGDLARLRGDLGRAEEQIRRAVAAWREAEEAYHRAASQGEDERMRREREREAVAASLESCVLSVRSDGVIEAAAGVTDAILGTPAAGLTGRELGEVIPVLRTAIGGRRPLESGSAPGELSYRPPGTDGAERTLRCRVAGIEDTFGRPIGITLYILQDVTQAVLAENGGPPSAEVGEAAAVELEPAPIPLIEGMIGHAPRMRDVTAIVRRVAPTASTVLITGESGTGKELIARALHTLSPRRDKPLVIVNCAAIPENLLESELFGHVRGAFTGAVADRRGLLRSADGGTIFLDEIGELPMSLQAKLLRVLQERSFTPVGSGSQVFVDVRIVAATNRDLESAVAQGRFRDDLFYRLNVIRVEMPPLRERREDLPALIDHFLGSFAASMGKPVPELAPEARRRLLDHSFPGNIRELENVLEHAVALSTGGRIEESDLPQSLVTGRVPNLDPARAAPPPPPPPPERNPVEEMRSKGSNLDLELEDYEKRFINEALRLAGGVRKRAAELLGINYRSLRHRLAKYGYEDRPEP